jgi:hypothetical protein
MALTNFFIRRPCIAIITPYIILLILSVISVAAGMFNLGDITSQDDGLIMGDPIVIDHNIVRIAVDDLNRKESKIDKVKEDLLANQVRYEFEMMESPVILLYENKS